MYLNPEHVVNFVKIKWLVYWNGTVVTCSPLSIVNVIGQGLGLICVWAKIRLCLISNRQGRQCWKEQKYKLLGIELSVDCNDNQLKI